MAVLIGYVITKKSAQAFGPYQRNEFGVRSNVGVIELGMEKAHESNQGPDIKGEHRPSGFGTRKNRVGAPFPDIKKRENE